MARHLNHKKIKSITSFINHLLESYVPAPKWLRSDSQKIHGLTRRMGSFHIKQRLNQGLTYKPGNMENNIFVMKKKANACVFCLILNRRPGVADSSSTFLVFQPFEKLHLTASKFIQQNI